MATTEQCDVTIRGVMTALITPFRDGEVDWSGLRMLVQRQIEGGADWLVPLGTTGESPTLSNAEREKVLDTVLKAADGRRPVMAGTGSNDTAETVERTKQAAKAGARAALVVAPCYNRPTPEGLYRHFAKVAKSVELPIVLYNVPARTGVDIDNETVARLRRSHPNIVAIKDATGGVDRITDLQQRCDIAVLSGDDVLTWPMMAMGAVGVISVLANLCPSRMKTLVSAAARGDMEQALRAHRKLDDLAAGIATFGPNPIPIKTAMALTGLIKEEFRLPLCPLDQKARDGIAAVLRRHEIMETATV